MYLTISNTDESIKTAESFIAANDRALFKPFLEYIEQYCTDKPIMFSGQIATELLNDLPVSKDSYQFELYCASPYLVAKDLITQMYNHFRDKSPFIPIHTMVLDTQLKNIELSISVGGRMLVKFISFGEYRGVNLIEAVKPVTLKSRFLGVDIKVIPVELYLIQCLRLLYTPAACDQWESYDRILDKLTTTVTEKTGAAESGSGFISVPAAEDAVKSAVKHLGLVYIGDYAVNELVNDLSKDSKDSNVSNLKDKTSKSLRLQAIYGSQSEDDDLEYILSIIRKKCKENKKISSGAYKIESVKYHLNLPSDFRIVKHTVYITNEKNKFPLIDLFNSATYEQIPYRNLDGVKIGHPFVVMRFILIDLWVIKLITKLGSNPSQRENNLRENYNKISALPREFQLENYYGVYLNENVARKHLMKALGMTGRFYPVSDHPEDIEQIKKDRGILTPVVDDTLTE